MGVLRHCRGKVVGGCSGVDVRSVVDNDSVLFWDITQRVVVKSYRRFGTNYRAHLDPPRYVR